MVSSLIPPQAEALKPIKSYLYLRRRQSAQRPVDMVATGVLDSPLIVFIISYCEWEFQCVFGPDESEEQHFETIITLADQISRHLQKAKEMQV